MVHGRGARGDGTCAAHAAPQCSFATRRVFQHPAQLEPESIAAFGSAHIHPNRRKGHVAGSNKVCAACRCQLHAALMQTTCCTFAHPHTFYTKCPAARGPCTSTHKTRCSHTQPHGGWSNLVNSRLTGTKTTRNLSAQRSKQSTALFAGITRQEPGVTRHPQPLDPSTDRHSNRQS